MIEMDKLVLLIIFLIVLVICVALLLGYALPSGNSINLQNQIRQCCSAFRAYSENGVCPNPQLITCPDNTNLNDLRMAAHMTDEQIGLFCGCST